MAQDKIKNTYLHTHHSRSISSKTNDISSTQKNVHFAKENFSSVVNVSKNKQERNRKKAIIIKSKMKNINMNTNFNDGNELSSPNKNLLHIRRNIDNNNIKTFQNQNIHSYKYPQKSCGSSANINTSTESLRSIESIGNCFTSVSAPSLTKNLVDEKNNFLAPTHIQITNNRGLHQTFLSNQPILNFNSKLCSQQENSENWSPRNAQFSQYAKNINEVHSNEAKNSIPTKSVSLANTNKSSSNFKQQNILKNNFSTYAKGINNNCYVNQDVNGPSSNSSVNQHCNRVKTHQNYNNLTYVVTEKENVRSSCNEKQKSEMSNLKTENNCSENFNASCISLSKSKPSDIEANSLKTFDLFDTEQSNNVFLPTKNNTIYAKNTLEPPIYTNQEYRTVAQIFPNYASTAPPEYENLHKIHNYNFLQQNLTYFDTKPNFNVINVHSPHRTFHQPESSTIYMNNQSTLSRSPKRIEKRNTHGKKTWFPTLKSFHTTGNTPPDRFLAKSYLMEVKLTPKQMLNNSEWDKLSSEIWQKFSLHQQKELTYRKKIYLWKYLYLSIKRNFPRYGLYLVGSTITGFGTNSSDVDMCLVHRASFALDSRFEAISHLNNIQEYLKTLEIFEQFHLIEAKVPILRFSDLNNSIEVDLNFNNSVGIRNTHLLYCYSQLDWRLRPLALTVKLWARYHNINNAKTMTISSYSLVLMVIHFLQFGVNPPVLPCLHEMYPEKFNIILTSNEFGFVDMIEEIKPYKSENNKTLGELFLLFLEYYSYFNYSKYAISIRTGKLLLIDECRKVQSVKNDIHQWRELCIEEPFDLTNTARSVYDSETFDKIKNIFLTSWQILKNTMELNNIFAPLYIFQETKVPKN